MDRIYLPLHPAQRDVYLDQLIHINSAHYNIGGYIQLRGVLNIEIFQELVRTTPDVFDTFRQRFDHQEAEPVCYLDQDYAKDPLQLLDFSNQANPAESAKLWMQASFNKPILIKTESLPFEESLLRISETEHWFFGKYHHLITDGYGFIVLVNYLAKKYRSLVEGETIEFNYPSYGEELVNASSYYSSPEYKKDEMYWKDRIAEIPKKILPAKYLSNETGDKISDTFILDLTSAQQNMLEQLQLETKAGIQQLSIAALLIFFGKTSEQNEFVFGIPVHKRGSRKLREIVGMFSGILACKATYEPERPLIELIKEITSAQKADYRHQHYPIGDLGRNLKAIASEGYLFQVSIDYEPLNFKLDFGQLLQTAILRVPNDQERNPLQLCWLDYGSDQPLKLQVHYGNAYFNKTEIELFVKRILFILEQFPVALHQPIGTIDILPNWEKALLDEWNDTAADYPKNKTMVTLFEEAVVKYPNNIALVLEDSQLTYKELNERANQLAHFLVKKGVHKETLVPICIHRSVEMLVGILGVLKAGAAYVPIEPDYPEDRIRFVMEDCQATIVLTNTEVIQKIASNTKAHCVLLDGDWATVSNESVQNLSVIIQPKQLAYIIYTSGSTGKPKGVMVEHSGVVNLIIAQTAYFGIDCTERILQFSNFCFDASVEQIFLALFNGASLHLVPENVQLNIDLFDRYLKENKITHLHATPAFLETLHAIEAGSLKRMIGGGDICKKELSAHWKQRVSFYNEYGPTETTITAVEYIDQPDQQLSTYSLPIGKPVANTSLYILDSQKNLLPIGVVGELYIAGAGVARGYLNRPTLTSDKFIPNPFKVGANQMMYNSGDLARWLPDGNIAYLGRKDDQVKIRGYRIEPGEIERVLLQSDLVDDAVVLAKDDSTGNKRLICYIVPNGEFEKIAIQNYLKTRLPEFMIPAVWVVLDRLPLTHNGKLDKKALREPGESELIKRQYVAPRNELELNLVNIWQEILHVEQVGIHDNFFELGGHSLLAIRLVSAIRRKLEIEIAINDVFIYPTVAAFAGNIVEKVKNPSLPMANIKYLVGVKPGGSKIPLYIVCGAGGTALRFKQFAEMMDLEQPVYVLQPPIDSNATNFPDNFELIAKAFIDEVLIQNPGGPYALSGHCLGGFIAFEMARQLEAMGKKVHMLAMFDVIIRKVDKLDPPSFKNFYHKGLFLKRYLGKVMLKLDFETFLLRKHTKHAIKYKMNAFNNYLNKVRNKNANPKQPLDIGMEIFDDASSLYIAASKNYKLVPYSGEVVLFYAKDHYYFMDRSLNVEFKKLYLNDETKNMWKDYTGGLKIHDVDGEHSTIFDPEHGTEFARLLQHQIDKGALD